LSSTAPATTAVAPPHCRHAVSLQPLACYETAELGIVGDWRSGDAPTAAVTAAAAAAASAATGSDTVAHSAERAAVLAAVMTHFSRCSYVTADNYQQLLPLLSTLAQHVELCMYRLAESLADHTDTASMQMRLELLTAKFRHACNYKWGKHIRERAATAKRKRDATAAAVAPVSAAAVAAAPSVAVAAVTPAGPVQQCWSSVARRALLDSAQVLQQQQQQQQFDSEDDDTVSDADDPLQDTAASADGAYWDSGMFEQQLQRAKGSATSKGAVSSAAGELLHCSRTYTSK
jgi:hypothetical protein